jgi:hypothetical protein
MIKFNDYRIDQTLWNELLFFWGLVYNKGWCKPIDFMIALPRQEWKNLLTQKL